MNNELLTSIENPTLPATAGLAHFRHFSSLLTIEDPAFLGRNEYQESSYLRAYKALHLSRTLYKSHLFMQNKANLPDAQMNVNKVLTKDYENKTLGGCGKNKPNSNPNKANFRKTKMNISSLSTKDYIKYDDFTVRKNKPNSNPIKPNSCPLSVWRVKRYLAKMGHHELKYVDRLG